MTRILLFVATNVAVLAVLTVVLRVLGIDSMLDEQGTGIDFESLLVMSAIIGFTGSLISLFTSKYVAKMATRAHVITNPRTAVESWLVNTVQRQAQAAGIGMPEVAIYDSPDPNAFATGWNRNAALVAVSTGLLQRLDRNEVEAVLGHEVSHVANGDMVTLALLQGVVNTFVVFLSRVVGFIVDRVVFRTERGYGPGFLITTLVAQVALGILASMIVAWFSRRREFRADAGGAALAGRSSMIGALQRLGGAPHPAALPESMEAFGIFGRTGAGLRRLLASHPPIPERVAALERAR